MPRYEVTLPIAGHITVTVEADDENSAIAAAFESDELLTENIVGWEALERFNSGKVCHCPSPWNAEAALVDDEEAA